MLSMFMMTELIIYNDFVKLTVLSTTLAWKQVDLKKVRAAGTFPTYSFRPAVTD